MWQILFSLFFLFLSIVNTILCIWRSFWWPSREPTFRADCRSLAHFTCMTIWFRPFSRSTSIGWYVFAEEWVSILNIVSSFSCLNVGGGCLLIDESLGQVLIKLHRFLLLHHYKCYGEKSELNEKDLAQGAGNVLDGASARTEKNLLCVAYIDVKIWCLIERINAGSRVKGPADGAERVAC